MDQYEKYDQHKGICSISDAYQKAGSFGDFFGNIAEYYYNIIEWLGDVYEPLVEPLFF